MANVFVAQRTPVTTNTTYYVNSSTGNDNNNGLTANAAFKTIQHTIDIVCFTLDIENDVTITIQLADGTYAEEVTLYNWIGNAALDPISLIASSVVIQGNLTSPQNVVLTGLSTPVKNYIFTEYSVYSPWKITGVTFAPISATYGFGLFFSSNLTLGTIVFGTTAAPNFSVCIALEGSSINGIGSQITLSGSWNNFIICQNSVVDLFEAVINITASINFNNAFVGISRNGSVLLRFATINLNGNTVTGKSFHLNTGGKIYGVNQNINFLPGSILGTNDDGSGDYDGIKFVGAQMISGPPTASVLPPGFVTVFKDTTGGGVVLAYNDGGTIKQVALT